MQWLIYAFIGLTIWSATAVADRFFLLRHVRSKRFYVVVPALLQFAVVLVVSFWFGIPHASSAAMWYGLASGAMESVTLYYLYVASSKEEISRVFSLTMAGPVLTLVLGYLLLRETLDAQQLLAFVLFLFGGILLAARFDGSWSLTRAWKPLLVGSVLSSIFTIFLRAAFVASDFWTGFFFSRLGFFIAGLFILLFFYKEISSEWQRLRPAVRVGIITNQLVSLSGHAFYFLAISLAAAALVQSVDGAQSAIVFVFALVVSIWSPRLLEESTSPRDLVQKGIGILFVVAAAILLTIG